MSRAVEDYTKPGAKLFVKALLPGLDEDALKDTLTQFLTEAGEDTSISGLSTEAKRDQATDYSVGARVWGMVWEVRQGNPSSRTIEGKGAASYTQGQIDAAAAERDRYQAKLDTLIAVEAQTNTPVFAPIRSLR